MNKTKVGHAAYSLLAMVILIAAAFPTVAEEAAPAGGEGRAIPNPFFAMDTGTEDERHQTPASQVEMLKKLGYVGIDHMGCQGIPELLAETDRHELRLFAIYTEANIDPGEQQWKSGLEDAIRALKGRDTVIWLPITSEKHKPSSHEGDADAVKLVRRIAAMAGTSGLRVALYPHTWFLIERVEDAVRIAKKVDRPNVGVTFNLCHWLKVDGQNLEARLKEAKPHLFMVTVNGADAGGKDRDRLIQPLDRGSFDVLDVLRALKDLDYTGPIGLQGYGIGGDVHDNLKRSMNAWRALGAGLAGNRPAP